VTYDGPGPGVGTYLDVIVSAAVAGRYLVTADSGTRITLQLLSEGTVTAGNAVAESIALHAGATGATGSAGAAGANASAFSPQAFAAGIATSDITENNDATARTYGYKVVPVRSGMLSTGMRWLAKTAADQSFKACLWNSTALLESITVAHTAGTSSHTTTWTTGAGAGGAHVLTCGRSYWLTLYCTTAGKSRNVITYGGDLIQGPELSVGQFFMADGIWIRQTRFDVGDTRPTSDGGTGAIYPITGLFSG
jgi:hypothetical protein